MPVLPTPEIASFVVLAGFLLGVALGLTGVGAGVILTPFLILGIGLRPSIAVGTSLVFSLFTKVAGAAQHLRQGTADLRVVAWLGAGSVPTALGVSLLLALPHGLRLSEQVTGRLVTGAVVLSAVTMTVRLTGVLPQWGKSAGAGPALVPVGAAIGLIFALTSIGSGSVTVAALALLTPIGIASLVGTDMVQAALLAAVTAPIAVVSGRADIGVAGLLIIGSVPGVLLGSFLAPRLPSWLLKTTVLVAVWTIAIRLI